MAAQLPTSTPATKTASDAAVADLVANPGATARGRACGDRAVESA